MLNPDGTRILDDQSHDVDTPARRVGDLSDLIPDPDSTRLIPDDQLNPDSTRILDDQSHDVDTPARRVGDLSDLIPDPDSTRPHP